MVTAVERLERKREREEKGRKEGGAKCVHESWYTVEVKTQGARTRGMAHWDTPLVVLFFLVGLVVGKGEGATSSRPELALSNLYQERFAEYASSSFTLLDPRSLPSWFQWQTA